MTLPASPCQHNPLSLPPRLGLITILPVLSLDALLRINQIQRWRCCLEGDVFVDLSHQQHIPFVLFTSVLPACIAIHQPCIGEHILKHKEHEPDAFAARWCHSEEWRARPRPPRLMHPSTTSCCLLPECTSASGVDCSLVRSSLSLLYFPALTDMSCALLPY